MGLPVSPQNGPYEALVEEGRCYRWCSCGLSKTQPWCDDSHEDTGFEPIEFIAPITASFFMCGCKRSANKPYCFGNCAGNNRVGGFP
jgi:CDGSH iron-sulfur domain-containing protein 3